VNSQRKINLKKRSGPLSINTLSHQIVQHAPLLLSHYVDLTTSLVLKYLTGLSIILLLPCGIFIHLIYVDYHIILLLLLNISPWAVCLSSWERSNPSLSLFFSSLVSILLSYLRTDISGIDQAFLFQFVLILCIIHPHLIHANFLFYLHYKVSENKLTLLCLMFISTIKQLQFYCINFDLIL